MTPLALDSAETWLVHHLNLSIQSMSLNPTVTCHAMAIDNGSVTVSKVLVNNVCLILEVTQQTADTITTHVCQTYGCHSELGKRLCVL